MNLENVMLLGVKRSVLAISRSNGQVLWTTRLPGSMQEFITIACDGERVFAYSGGHLSGLDLETGRLLWTNGLPGCGYGLGTICFPFNAGGSDENGVAAVAAAVATQQAQTAAAASG